MTWVFESPTFDFPRFVSFCRQEKTLVLAKKKRFLDSQRSFLFLDLWLRVGREGVVTNESQVLHFKKMASHLSCSLWLANTHTTKATPKTKPSGMKWKEKLILRLYDVLKLISMDNNSTGAKNVAFFFLSHFWSFCCLIQCCVVLCCVIVPLQSMTRVLCQIDSFADVTIKMSYPAQLSVASHVSANVRLQ